MHSMNAHTCAQAKLQTNQRQASARSRRAEAETCRARSVPISASNPHDTRSALVNSFLPGQLGLAAIRACLQVHELLWAG